MLPESRIDGSAEGNLEQAQKLSTKIEGGVMYGGNTLLGKVLELVKEMGSANIGKVSVAIFRLFAELTRITGLEMDCSPFL